MILRDRLDLYEVTGVIEEMDPETFELVLTEQIREWAMDVRGHVGRADGMARVVSMGGNATGWLPDDEAVAIVDPVPDLPVHAPTTLRVRHRGRVWVVMAVRVVMQGEQPHHLSVRLRTSR